MKQKKFLLAVIYGLPRRHLNSSENIKKNGKKLKSIFMIILELAESFETMNRPDQARPNTTRPDPTVTLLDGLFLGKYKR